MFKDRYSSDFDVTVRTKSRPILPSVKRILLICRTVTAYMIFQKLILGREFYNDRIFTVTFNKVPIILRKCRGSCLCFSLWLCGEGELILMICHFKMAGKSVGRGYIYA